MDLAESGSFPASERWIWQDIQGSFGEPKQHVIIHVTFPCSIKESKSSSVIEIARWLGQNLSTCFNSEWSHLAPTVRLGQTRTLKLFQSCFLPALVVGRQQMEASTSFAVRAGAFSPEQNLRLMLYNSAFVFSYTTAQQRLQSRSHRW